MRVRVPKLRLSRRSAVIAAAAVIAVGAAGWALAEGGVPLTSSSTPDPTTVNAGGGGDNVATAVNTHDGKSVVALALKITQTGSDTVDPANAAVAVASCTDCQTVAIAMEGVLVIGDPATFNPTNIALAINSECTNCQTLAAAYQTVVQNDTRVRITGAGRQQIADIRKDLNSLRESGLDIFTIKQRVNDAASRFTAVLQNEVVPIGKPDTAADAATTTTAAAPTTTTAPPATTTTTSPPAASTTTTPSTTVAP